MLTHSCPPSWLGPWKILLSGRLILQTKATIIHAHTLMQTPSGWASKCSPFSQKYNLSSCPPPPKKLGFLNPPLCPWLSLNPSLCLPRIFTITLSIHSSIHPFPIPLSSKGSGLDLDPISGSNGHEAKLPGQDPSPLANSTRSPSVHASPIIAYPAKSRGDSGHEAGEDPRKQARSPQDAHSHI